ncbi:hypothetical protein D3C87_2037670 [compost metagenome]
MYWEQNLTRDDADSILNFAMYDLEVLPIKRIAIYETVSLLGSSAWRENRALKLKGEKRQIKKLPNDPKIKWSDWKENSDIY